MEFKGLKGYSFLLLFNILTSAAPSWATAAPLCSLVFDDSSVKIKTSIGLNETQLAEMAGDARVAIDFSKGYFKLPNEVGIHAKPKNTQFDFPHYDSSSRNILYPYQFGKSADGKFYPLNRRHARDIFYHEFGHLIFHNNMKSDAELITLFHVSSGKKRQEGVQVPFIPERYLEQYISAYDELFADVFAVTLSQNPRAMVAGEYALNPKEVLKKAFKTPPEEILRARDFLGQANPKTWNEGEVHIALAPTRSAFKEDPYVIYLFANHPEQLAKISFDAIQFELTRLFSDDVAILPTLTVAQLNQRMIEVMNSYLQKHAQANQEYLAEQR